MKPDKRRNYSREDRQHRAQMGQARQQDPEDDCIDPEWQDLVVSRAARGSRVAITSRFEDVREAVAESARALAKALDDVKEALTITIYDEADAELLTDKPEVIKLSARQEKKARKKFNRERKARERAREAEELLELEGLAHEQVQLTHGRDEQGWGGF